MFDFHWVNQYNPYMQIRIETIFVSTTPYYAPHIAQYIYDKKSGKKASIGAGLSRGKRISKSYREVLEKHHIQSVQDVVLVSPELLANAEKIIVFCDKNACPSYFANFIEKIFFFPIIEEAHTNTQWENMINEIQEFIEALFQD